MLRLKVRYIAWTILCLISYFSYQGLVAVNEIDDAMNLPDYDFRYAAERAWDKEQPETALAMLDYIIENSMNDSPAAEQLRSDYCESLRRSNSAMGRMYAVGRGFVTGSANSKSELGGAVAGDFIVWGDIRDLTAEMLVSDDTDEVIVALSFLGIATTFYPPADPAASALKAVRKSGSLTMGLQGTLIKLVADIKVAKTTGKSVKLMLKNTLSPIVGLFEKSKTWSQFTTFMKHVDTSADALKITKIISRSPKNSAKLEFILLISAKKGRKMANNTLLFIDKYGQKGMDKIYKLARKGPKGVSFILKHPRILKNIKKSSNFAVLSFKDLIGSIYLLHGFLVKLALYVTFIAPVLYMFTKVLRKQKVKFNKTNAMCLLGSLLTILVIVIIWRSFGQSSLGHIYSSRREVAVSIEEEDTLHNDNFNEISYSSIITFDQQCFVPVVFDKLGFNWSQLFGDGDIRRFGLSLTSRGNDARSELVSEKLFYSYDEPKIIFIPCDFSSKALKAVGKEDVVNYLDRLIALNSISGNLRMNLNSASICPKDNDHLIIEQGWFRDSECAVKVGDSIYTDDEKLVGIVVESEQNILSQLTTHTVYIYPTDYDEFNFSEIFIDDCKKIKDEILKLRRKF